MTLRDDYVAKLEADNDELREKVRQLEHALGVHFDAPPIFDLSAQQARLFGALMERDLVTKEIGMLAIAKDAGDDRPMEKIVDVLVCHLRRKLKPFGIAIETNWGRGYWLTPAARDRAREFMTNRSPPDQERQARAGEAGNSAPAQSTSRDSAAASASVPHPITK